MSAIVVPPRELWFPWSRPATQRCRRCRRKRCAKCGGYERGFIPMWMSGCNHMGCCCTPTDCDGCASIASVTITFSGIISCGCIDNPGFGSSNIDGDPNDTWSDTDPFSVAGTACGTVFVATGVNELAYTGDGCVTPDEVPSYETFINISHESTTDIWTLLFFGAGNDTIFLGQSAGQLCVGGSTVNFTNELDACGAFSIGAFTGFAMATGGSATATFTYA